ncbi:MAG: hypothetical protein FJ012_00815 [Chloroflexi bacterium]|nr:hypothetical protein [Chloroflexota bacterium]
MGSRKPEIGLTIVSLLRILAVLAWACGLIYTSFAASNYADRTFATTKETVSIIFFGLMMTIVAGGVLYGLSWIVSLIQGIRQSKIGSDESKTAE